MIARRVALAVLIACAGLALPAQAHRIAIPTSQANANPRTGTWEFVHRLSSHDVEMAFLQTGEDISGLFDTPEGLDRIGQYVSARFSLLRREGPVAPAFIGAETEGEWVYAYFELPGLTEPVIIDNRLLFEVEPLTGMAATQALLNVRDGAGRLTTGVFTPAQPRQRVTLCFAQCAE